MSDPATPARARISFFVGKGGVGKSTLAAATALADARSGQRAVVVSTDQAHSVGDVLGVPVPPTGRIDAIQLVDTGGVDPGDAGGVLGALALDTLALLESRWRDTIPALVDGFPDTELASLAPEELSAFPGAQELLGLNEVAELAESGRWDHVIVDCASTADALRMLTLPGAVSVYAERAWPRHRRLVAAGEGGAVLLAGFLERISSAAERLTRLLVDEGAVAAHLVLTPERVVAAEAVRTLASLRLAGVRVAELIVNQVLMQDDSYEYRNLPAHPAFDWYLDRIGEQRAVLAELAGTVGDVALTLAPLLPGEPVGRDGLITLLDSARRSAGSAPPGPLRPIVELESGSGLGAVYRMRLELPHVESGELSLGRSGDDLIIGVGGMRRRVTLASVLRRCTVADATLRREWLTIRFRPDPRIWPQ